MKEGINVKGVPAAVGPYVHIAKIGSMYYCSGQLGLEPDTGVLKEGIEAQSVQALENIKVLLESQGLTFENVVKTTVFIADINDFGVVNEIYEKYMGNNPPARSCVEVSALPKAALVEIEVIASDL